MAANYFQRRDMARAKGVIRVRLIQNQGGRVTERTTGRYHGKTLMEAADYFQRRHLDRDGGFKRVDSETDVEFFLQGDSTVVLAPE